MLKLLLSSYFRRFNWERKSHTVREFRACPLCPPFAHGIADVDLPLKFFIFSMSRYCFLTYDRHKDYG